MKSTDPLLMEIQEEINREKMVKFVNKYGKLLIILGLILFALFAAFRGWKEYSHRQSSATGTEIYNIMRDLETKPQDEFTLKKLDQTAKSRGYREISLLTKAHIQVKNNDVSGATETYDAIARDAANEKVFRELASLNAANLLINTNPKADGLEKRLIDITAAGNSFRYNGMELLASFYLQNGEQAKADDVLKKLATDENTPVTISKRARELSPQLLIVEAEEPKDAE